jgi:hypothetical protein
VRNNTVCSKEPTKKMVGKKISTDTTLRHSSRAQAMNDEHTLKKSGKNGGDLQPGKF